MTRILYVVHQYPPEHIGGVELYTQTLAQQLAARQHEVSIFVPKNVKSATGLSVSSEDRVQIFRVPLGLRRPPAIFLSTFRQRALSRAWRKVLTQTQPEIVHVQHLMGLPVELIAWLSRAQIPFVVTLHDYYYFCANALLLTNYDQSVCAGPRRFINCGHCALARAGLDRWASLSPLIAPVMAQRNRLLKQALAGARRLIAPSEFVRQRHCRHFGWPPDRVRVITPGQDVPLDLAPDRSSTGTPLRIAFIGGIAPQKGVHVLIDAVNQLPGHDVQLSIYGDLNAFPEYVSDLHRRARSEQITFHGRLPHDQVWHVLRESDVLVVPSLSYESSSLISQEALAVRTPVIASDLGALRETTLQGGGLVFSAGDVAALRDILQRFLNYPTELDRLRAAIKPVRTIEQHVADLEEVYRELIRI